MRRYRPRKQRYNLTIYHRQTNLVGGWTNPSEKYARQIGNLPQVGVNINNYLKPPPRNDKCVLLYVEHPKKTSPPCFSIPPTRASTENNFCMCFGGPKYSHNQGMFNREWWTPRPTSIFGWGFPYFTNLGIQRCQHTSAKVVQNSATTRTFQWQLYYITNVCRYTYCWWKKSCTSW